MPKLASTLLLLAMVAAAEAATPESTLLAGLEPVFREPQQRCELLAARFDTIDLQLSLYREELTSLQVLVDGALVADSARAAVQLVAFESRAFGPASATIVLDRRYAGSLDRLVAGRRIEVLFVDRAGRNHPLFCGTAAIVRADPSGTRTDVVALIPRTGAELQVSAQYMEQNCVEVLTNLAQSAGLAVEVSTSGPHSVVPRITRNSLATWPFMLQLARQCRLDLALGSDGRLLVTDGKFLPPPAPPARTWSNMSWVEVAAQLAQNAGRAPDFRLTGTYPVTSFRQSVSDEDFLSQISIAARVSAWFSPGKLVLAEDGAWATAVARRSVPDGAPDLLLKRVIVTGSAGATRTFNRRISDPRAQAQDPERVPTEEATLFLGRSMPAAGTPGFSLASSTQVAGVLEAALVRLASQPATAYQRFLQDFARLHRPTLLHIYRLRPDGARVLDALGR